MLVRVTLTHTEANCPGYHREMLPETTKALSRLAEPAKEAGSRFTFSQVRR